MTARRYSQQQVPGFAVGAVLGVGEMRGEHDVDLSGGDVGGEDVPGVGGDHKRGDEVELSGKVGALVGGDVAFERASALVGGGI